MRIAVRTFAAYRDAVGEERLALDLPGGQTPRRVWTMLSDRYPDLRRFPEPARFAVNDEFVLPDHPLAEDDEVALIPPVSGGDNVNAGADATIRVALTEDPIDTAALFVSVRDDLAGAVVLFLGTVRQQSRGRRVEHLEYQAYTALAEREMRAIAGDALHRWPLRRVSLLHRTGHLEVGEISVGVAVSAPHRAEAFEAGRYLINTLKQRVPIWKKEVWGEGAEWIGQEDSAAETGTAPG